ncbi:hypothetical protein Q1695_015088 [Nippostrongylus brasiliensis]|nr:hypothetical protein Q1695_015088 [Nippostrongylus brasiliensis]
MAESHLPLKLRRVFAVCITNLISLCNGSADIGSLPGEQEGFHLVEQGLARGKESKANGQVTSRSKSVIKGKTSRQTGKSQEQDDRAGASKSSVRKAYSSVLHGRRAVGSPSRLSLVF